MCVHLRSSAGWHCAVCSFVEKEVATPGCHLYKCSESHTRQVQEQALAAMFGESQFVTAFNNKNFVVQLELSVKNQKFFQLFIESTVLILVRH